MRLGCLAEAIGWMAESVASQLHYYGNVVVIPEKAHR